MDNIAKEDIDNKTKDEDKSTVLSDVEEDEPVPINSVLSDDMSLERFKEVLAELDREKRARELAESSKSELNVKFNRLKSLAHEAIKKRDEAMKSNEKLSIELAEAGRLREESLKEKYEILKVKNEILKEKDEILKEKDEILKEKDKISGEKDEVAKAKDASRAEIENAAQMLVTGIDKISGKVSNFKSFNGLPRSQKYTGLPAVAYGVIKRTNEIVEELLKQVEVATKGRNEAREQMEQRNYEIAIEVSQLEATIGGLREEVSKREKSEAEKDEKISELEKELSEKLKSTEDEVKGLKELVNEYEDKSRNLEMKMDTQRPLLVEQLSLVSKIHDQLYDVIKIVDASGMDQSDFSESLFVPKETDIEENLRASLAGMESISELAKIVVVKTRDVVEDKGREVKTLKETASSLVKEKEHIGSLLRSALSRRVSNDLSSKTNELFKVAEYGLRESGIDFKFNDHLGSGSDQKGNGQETEKDEIYALAGALENIIKQSQIEIIDLQHSVDDLRAEISVLKEHVDVQGIELSYRKQRIEELEEKERVANENVEGLMLDIAAAEEEINRWKVAAQQEADAGKAVEHEFVSQLEALRHELDEAKQAVLEIENKLKFKEETATAAMAARDAAEKSLRLADSRASRLRDRVEELTHQLENLDTRDNSRGMSGPRYVCWPWEWLGLNFVGAPRSIGQQQTSNEMELSEPLM